MTIRLRQAVTLILGLAIIWNTTVYAHGGSVDLGANGGKVFQAGYIMYAVFLVGGYLLMRYEIPQRLIGILFGDSEKR